MQYALMITQVPKDFVALIVLIISIEEQLLLNRIQRI